MSITKKPQRKNSAVKLGKACRIDPRAVLGMRPLRSIQDERLLIGDNAVCMSGCVIYRGVWLGANAIIGHNAIIREENKIGEDFKLWNNSVIDYGCLIGYNVKVHCNCYVAQGTILEDGVFLGPGVTLANDRHPGCKRSRRCLQGPVVKKGAQVGANVTILPCVTIGEQALIGAGSVVTKDVPARAVMAGNPARVIATIDKIRCSVFEDKSYSDMLSTL
jgi:acetyltransferase-like isoleucine patch superfamily enzyme